MPEIWLSSGKLPKASGNGGILVDSARGDASYAQMYRTGSGVAQSIPTGTAWTKLTPFTANSNAFDSTPDHANDRIVIGRAGQYKVTFTRSFDVGTANTTWKSTVLKNGSEWAPSTQQVKMLNATTSTYACTSCQISCAAGDVLTIGVQHDNASSVNVTHAFATLSVEAVD